MQNAYYIVPEERFNMLGLSQRDRNLKKVIGVLLIITGLCWFLYACYLLCPIFQEKEEHLIPYMPPQHQQQPFKLINDSDHELVPGASMVKTSFANTKYKLRSKAYISRFKEKKNRKVLVNLSHQEFKVKRKEDPVELKLNSVRYRPDTFNEVLDCLVISGEKIVKGKVTLTYMDGLRMSFMPEDEVWSEGICGIPEQSVVFDSNPSISYL
jgi:hypothetical protein